MNFKKTRNFKNIVELPPITVGKLNYNYLLSWQNSTLGNSKIAGLFDGSLSIKPIEDYQTWLNPTSDLVFPFRPEQQTKLTNLRLRDYYGDATGNGSLPFEILYTSLGEEHSLGFFNGDKTEEWKEYPINDTSIIDNIIFRFTDIKAVFPTEIEFIGTQLPYTEPIYPRKRVKLVDQFHLNTYPYSQQDPTAMPGGIDEVRYSQLEAFSGLREYVHVIDIKQQYDRREVSEGQFVQDPSVIRFNIAYNGGYNMDARAQKGRDIGKPILFTIINNFEENMTTYTDADQGYNALVANGEDRLDPETWRNWGSLFWQLGARYGVNTYDNSRLEAAINEFKYYHPAGFSKKLSGLNLIDYIECFNEPDKDWKGIPGFYRPEEQALAYSVVADGHKGALTGDIGLKNASPNIKLVMGGLYNVPPQFIRGMFAYWKKTRGLRVDGTIDCPVDVFNFHQYNRRDSDQQGIPYQQTTNKALFIELVKVIRELAPTAEIWKTEAGYATNPSVDRSYAAPTQLRTSEQRQGDMTVLDGLGMARLGIDRTYIYQDYDEDTVDPIWDKFCGVIGRPTQAYSAQIQSLLSGYELDSIIENEEDNPDNIYVDKYSKMGSNTILALYKATNNDEEESYSVFLPNGGILHTLQDTGNNMNSTTLNIGNQTIVVKETACFLEIL